MSYVGGITKEESLVVLLHALLWLTPPALFSEPCPVDALQTWLYVCVSCCRVRVWYVWYLWAW